MNMPYSFVARYFVNSRLHDFFKLQGVMRNIFFNHPDLYPFDRDNKTSDFHQSHVIFTIF